jgi:hypothetical protein
VNGGVEGVERIYRQNDDENKCRADHPVDDSEEDSQRPVPPDLWSPSSKYPLSEEDVDDVDKQDASVDENAGSDGDRDIMRFTSPDDT